MEIGEQGSESWLAFRRKHVMASDSPIIMGEAPWGTPRQIFETKKEISGEALENFAMARGKMLEEKVRDRFILRTGHEIIPAVVLSKEYPLFGASLDGVNFEQRFAVEIKCPGIDNFNKIKQSKEPPLYYRVQMEQQIFCADLDKIIFIAYWQDEKSEDEIEIEYLPDLDLRKKIIEAGTHFWNEYMIPNVPPPLTDRDVLTVTDPQLVEYFETYAEMAKDIEQREKQLLAIRRHLESKITHAKVRCGPVMVSKTAKGYTFRVNKESSETQEA